jgi:predicted flap endonuclease-1-like 5' DNA nuclease
LGQWWPIPHQIICCILICCNAAFIVQRERLTAMTLITPDPNETAAGLKTTIPGFETLLHGWSAAFQPTEMSRVFLDTQTKLFGLSIEWMLLPLTALRNVSPKAAKPPGAPVRIAADAPQEIASAPTPAVAAVSNAISDDVAGVAPALLEKPEGKPDDLLLIKGIGPKLNQLLNSLGIWHFRQIVSWTPAEIAWVNAKIDFKGRIQRERWQPQAAELMRVAKAA